jgi:hypothetical protein
MLTINSLKGTSRRHNPRLVHSSSTVVPESSRTGAGRELQLLCFVGVNLDIDERKQRIRFDPSEQARLG